MILAYIVLAVLGLSLIAYAVLGGADFGVVSGISWPLDPRRKNNAAWLGRHLDLSGRPITSGLSF